MSSNPRASRSRFSSPLHLSGSPSGHNRGMTTEGQRNFMQRWLEPPVQNKASFQEAGLIRGGVLENMAPLGTLPKGVVLKKSNAGEPVASVGNGASGGVKRIVLKKSSATASATPTPTPTAPTPPARVADAISEHAEELPEARVDASEIPTSPLSRPVFDTPPFLDGGNDEEYIPRKPKLARSISSHTAHSIHTTHSAQPVHTNQSSHSPATPIFTTPGADSRRHSNRRRSARPSPTPTPTPTPNLIHIHNDNHHLTSIPIHSSPTHPQQLMPTREPEEKELVDKVVETAVDEAIRHFRYPTAWALRLLYDEHSTKPGFVSMIEDIYYQRADIETIQEFNRLVSEKKKDGRKDDKACHYFVPPPTTGLPQSACTPQKPKPAPYSDLITMDLPTPHKEATVERDSDGHISKKQRLDNDDGVNSDVNSDANLTQQASGLQANGAAGMSGIDVIKSSTKSPRGKKIRSGSVSSSSSLSSVPDDAVEDFDGYMGEADEDDDRDGQVRVSTASLTGAQPSDAQDLAGLDQPISGHKEKSSKKRTWPADNRAPSPNTTSLHPSRDSSMPTTGAATNNESNEATASLAEPEQQSENADVKFPSRFGDLDNSNSNYMHDRLRTKLENESKTEESTSVSEVRPPSLGSEEVAQPDDFALLPPPPPEHVYASKTPVGLSRPARAAKKKNEDLDNPISPTLASFGPVLEPRSARGSRAATPANVRSVKKPRGGPRVKTSPMKKKGTSAGIPRGSGERPSPAGLGATHNQDDNDDSCYTCGGGGDLVCCDGCHYSFHFLCIDPPMDEGHMPDEWYCNECTQRYVPTIRKPTGLFGKLLAELERKNPRSFGLPEDIRERFEGVKTGPEGEYEEVATVAPKPKTKKKKDEEDAFDFFKVCDANGPVLCHHCSKGAGPNRLILPCSVCGLNWHLDCLDPPLAVPPAPRTWRCPCHIEDLSSNRLDILAPAHRYRKVKNAPVIEQAYSRGLKNNGWVEIDNDASDDEEPDTIWHEGQDFGRVFRVSEQGIRKDFLSAVKRRVHQRSAQVPPQTSYPAQAIALGAQSLEERQAALNLCQLAQGHGDGSDLLVQALVSQCSPAVMSMIALGDATRLVSGDLTLADKTSLQAMLAQVDAMKDRINKLLTGRASSSTSNGSATSVVPNALTPASSQDGSTMSVNDTAGTQASVAALEDTAMQLD